VSRVLLMVLFVLWMAWRPQAEAPGAHLLLRVAAFVGGYIVLVLGLAMWARRLARRVVNDDLHSAVIRFNKVVEYSRWLIPLWYAAGLYLLGWGELLQLTFSPTPIGEPIAWQGLLLPTTFLGVTPPLLAWMALWWAQYPADRAMREEAMVHQLESDLPLIAPPRFSQYFAANFRMQVLFICLPLLLIVAVRDLFTWSWAFSGYELTEDVQGGLFLLAMAVVFITAPMLLVRVLPTEPLPPGPLRHKLEQMCRHSGLRYRQILLWNTNRNICNAGVMGLFPRVRYILLSDALIESMTEEQVEAVFAHELGHVVHRHMVWYVIFFVVFMVAMSSLGQAVEHRLTHPQEILSLIGVAGCMVCFSFISRQCERQADVYAARLMEVRHRTLNGDTDDLVLSAADLVAPLSPAIAGAPLEVLTAPATEPNSNAALLPVGRHGAAVFSSALHRVAQVNNIPLRRFEWLHGSIYSRLDFLKSIAGHPRQTERFDRQMQRIYGLLLVGLFVSLLWVATTILKETSTRPSAHPTAAAAGMVE
jgi:STE24 endopeptidase